MSRGHIVRRYFGMVMFARRAAAVVATASVVVGLAGVLPAAPAAATTWPGTVVVSVSTASVNVTDPRAVVTASVDTALVSPQWLALYDNTGQLVVACDSSQYRSAYTAACEVFRLRQSTTVVIPTNSTRQYTAYVTAGQPPSSAPTSGIVAVSQPVGVTNVGWNGSITLTSSRTEVDASDTTAVLTATVDTKMAGPYWLSIYDSLGQRIGGCNGASTYYDRCTTPGLVYSMPVTVPVDSSRTFTAYVSQTPFGSGPAPATDVRATSAAVTVTNPGWSGVVELTVDRDTVDVHGPTAVVTAEVGTRLASGYFLSIYDATTGELVASCDASAAPSYYTNACDVPGYSRSLTVVVPTNGTRSYTAYVTKGVPPSGAVPTTNVRAASNTVYVANSGWTGSVELEVTPGEVSYLDPSATLVATVTPSLAGDYQLSIYDEDGTFVGGCDASPAPNTVAQACDVPTIRREVGIVVPLDETRSFTAYVSRGTPPMNGPPTNDVRAVSSTVAVHNRPWAGTVSVGGTVVDGQPFLVMTASPQLAYPYWIAVYDESGQWAAGCAAYSYMWGTSQPFLYCEPQAGTSIAASPLGGSGTYTPYVTLGVPPLNGPPSNAVAVGSPITPEELGPLFPGELDGGYNPSEDCGQPCHGDPVNSMTGEFFETNVDLSIGGPFKGFDLERDFSTARRNVQGPFGYGWSSNLDMSLTRAPGSTGTALSDSSQVVVRQENGSRTYFSLEDGAYTALPRVRATLTRQSDGSFVFARRAEEFFRFAADGRLERIEDRNGIGVDLVYDAAGRVVSLSDGNGRSIDLTWVDGHIVAASDQSGREVTYDYDQAGTLHAVTLADGSVATYGYDAQRRVATIGHRDGATTTNAYDGSSRVTSQTDPLGRTTTFDYGAEATTVTDPSGMRTVERYSFGKLMSVTRAENTRLSATVAYTYGPQHNVETVTDPLGRVTRYLYDDRGNRTEITDALGRVTRTTFDGWNNPVTITNPLGETTSLAYDARGNPLSVTSPDGALTSFTVDSAGAVLSSTDPTGRTTTYTYDEHGFLATATGPDGATAVSSYDSVGRLLSSTEARGNAPGATAADYTVSFSYDAVGRPLTATDPLGALVAQAYDAAGRPTVTTDALGAATTNVYDAAGQLTSVTDALGNTTTMTYDAAGRVRTVTDALGVTTTNGYDTLGRLVSVTDALGRTTSTEYDLAGRVTASVMPSGARTTYTYDAADQLLTVTDPLGGVTQTTYDAAGRPLTVTDADGRAVTTTYDAAGRPSVVTRADGSTVAWTYDAAGRVLTYTDAAGDVTTYTYDSAGRRATATDVAGRTTSYAYGPSGLLELVTLPGGGTVGYAYDAAGRRTGVDYSDATPDVTYAYDAAGRVTAMADGTGTTSYSYDALGRLLGVNTPRGDVGYEWDDVGQLTALTYPNGDVVERAYDDVGQLTSVTDWAARQFTFDWTEDGQLESVTYPNGVVTSQARDAAGQVTGMTTASASGMDLLNMAYGYSDGGLLTDRSVARGAEPALASSFTWDGQSRVDSVSGEGAGDVAFDAVGSVTLLPDGRAMAYDDGRQLTSMTVPGAAGGADVTTTLTYDGRGNRLTSTSDAGPAAGTVTHAYDLANRLTSLTAADGGVTSYTYDGNGMRTSAIAGGDTDTFVWDVAAGYPLLLVDGEFAYVYGASGVPLAQEATADGSVDYLHTDEVGSVVATTDASGAVTSEAEYDLYGVAQQAGTALLCTAVTRFGYAGEYTDPTGYVYLRARYYDPATAQFVTVDPLVDSTGNPYGYTGGNPLQFGDPLGLLSIDDVGNMAAGFGDTVTFGGTRWVREQLGVNDVVDTCSGFYQAGGYAGQAAQVVLAFASGGLSVAYDAVGAAVSAGDAYAAISRGDVLGALLAAAGALPGVPGAFRGASDAASVAVASGRGVNNAVGSVVRSVAGHEVNSGLFNELKARTFESGLEHALVRYADGARAILSGGETGISGLDDIAELIAHTHPYHLPALGPSASDYTALSQLGQQSSVLLEHGAEIIFSITDPAYLKLFGGA